MDSEKSTETSGKQHRHLSTRDALRAAAVDLISTARREVCICAPVLDAAFYNRADLTQALAHFIARRAGNQIRIVVEDGEHMLLADVRLVELARRFSDLLRIRRLAEQDHGLAEMFIVADAHSCLHQRDIMSMDATCDFHAAPLALPLARRFETIWAASEPLPGLHPFSL